MRLNYLSALCCLFLTLLFSAGVCYAGAAETYRQARQEYDLLLASQQKQLYRENWQRVIQRFDAFVDQYPSHERAPAALYLAGKASQRLYGISRRAADNEAAVAFYKRLADLYPASNLADDGLVLAAEALESHAKKPADAYLLYRKAVDRYPQGDMVTLARNGIRRLAAHAPAEKKPVPAAATVVAPPRVPGEQQLTAIRHWDSPEYTRIVLEVNGAVTFRSGSLPGDLAKGIAPRIYIDLSDTVLGSGVESQQSFGEGLLRQIRSAPQPDRSTRVVLDLAVPAEYKAFALKEPDRVVIDLVGTKQQVITANPAEIRALPTAKGDPIGQVLGQQPEESRPQVRLAETGINRLRRIVVDAGHGGKDPGAIGPNGTKEKDVNLSLALELAKRLRKEFGCQVILTRDKDVYLPLEERTAIANRVGADLFISIHANASHKRSVRGVETYYLNFSNNDKAAAVAARENGTSLKQVGDLEMILFDLMANAKINESSRLAAEIQSSLVTNLSRHFADINDHGVRQGPFYVLLGATMPSVLVETGYISNPQDEKLIRTRKFQERAADAIVAGVEKFARDSRMIANK